MWDQILFEYEQSSHVWMDSMQYDIVSFVIYIYIYELSNYSNLKIWCNFFSITKFLVCGFGLFNKAMLLLVAIRPKCIGHDSPSFVQCQGFFLLNVMDFTHYKELHKVSFYWMLRTLPITKNFIFSPCIFSHLPSFTTMVP